MIKLNKIKHIYTNDSSMDSLALEDINLYIGDKDYVSIVGQSGSGKSTLLSVMSGILSPTEGQVLFEGTDIYKLNQKDIAQHRNQNIGFIFQNYYLEPKFSAFENVAIPLLNQKNLSTVDIENRVVNALKEVGLGEKMDKLVSNLSGGERQRVAIARAIICNPKVIFADEPTGNLDTKNGNLIIELLDKLHNNGITIVLVTHNEIQAQRANRLIKIEDGHIIMESNNE